MIDGLRGRRGRKASSRGDVPRIVLGTGRWRAGGDAGNGYGSMPLTVLDIVVIAVVLISAILAMVRGFVREVLSVASWVAAVAAAYFLYKPVVPLVQPYIESSTVATIIAAAAIFFIALIIASYITMRDCRLRHRQPRRRHRPRPRFRLRRGARRPARRHRAPLLQLAGADAAGLGRQCADQADPRRSRPAA